MAFNLHGRCLCSFKVFITRREIVESLVFSVGGIENWEYFLIAIKSDNFDSGFPFCVLKRH